jgi:hypothetical protein
LDSLKKLFVGDFFEVLILQSFIWLCLVFAPVLDWQSYTCR